MRYALISDIHGNLHALQAVLEALKEKSAERVACLGDIVGYGAHPNECMDAVRDLTDAVVVGNHDQAATGQQDITWFNRYAQEAARWTRRTLRGEHLDYLRNLPWEHRERGLLFVHSSPVDPPAFDYLFGPGDAQRALRQADVGERVVFVGHSHTPFDYEGAEGRLINVGSVGQPRDGDPRAAFTLFDTDTGERELVRVRYDIAAAQQAIHDAGLPGFLADRLARGQ